MGTILQDVRYGARMLVRNWGFTLVAVITLALGIGANTSIFSVINAVLIKPLPVAEPERLVTVWETNRQSGEDSFTVSYPDFADWVAQSKSFEKLAAFDERDLTLVGVGDAVRLRGAMVTSDLFSLLGVSAAQGKIFGSDDDKPGVYSVALSDSLWRRRFNADPGVIGRAISLNGRSYNVVGVMPAGFSFPFNSEPRDIWINSTIDVEGPVRRTGQRGNHYLEVIGRLKPGVSLAQAQAEMETISGNISHRFPDTNSEFGSRVEPFYERVVGDVSKALWLLLGAVGAVLLIACGNVANLLLARSAVRQREMAIRAALGANRSRVVRQLLTESLLLSILGGLAGLVIAMWGTDLLISMVPDELPRATESAVDLKVLGFTLLISILTGMIFGLVPTWHATRTDLTQSLKEGGRTSGEGYSGGRTRAILIVSQVAIALSLLLCAGLLLNSFWRLQKVSPGFDPQNVLTFRIALPPDKYAANERIEDFYERIVSRVESIPGVTGVSAIAPLPLSGSNSAVGFAIEGIPTETNQPFPNETSLRAIRPDYFKTMGISILQGRDFDDRDNLNSSQVVIINQTLARRFFPNQNPVGRRINPSFSIDQRGILWREIIGVVGDIRHASLSEEAGPEVYVAHRQVPLNSLTIVARTGVDPRSVINPVRKEVASLDKDLPVYNVRTLDEYLSSSVSKMRFNTFLLSIFAAIALLLTAVGLYGVMAYSVAQRTHEIGIRIALGARPADVRRMVVRQGMKLTFAGMAIGGLASVAATRLIAGMLFNVSASDPWTIAGITLLLMAVTFLASYIPARRATRVDPLIALRNE